MRRIQSVKQSGLVVLMRAALGLALLGVVVATELDRIKLVEQKVVKMRGEIAAESLLLETSAAALANRTIAGLDDILSALRGPGPSSHRATLWKSVSSTDDGCVDDDVTSASTFDELDATASSGNDADIALMNDIDFTAEIAITSTVLIHSGRCFDTTKFTLSGMGVTRLFSVAKTAVLRLLKV